MIQKNVHTLTEIVSRRISMTRPLKKSFLTTTKRCELPLFIAVMNCSALFKQITDVILGKNVLTINHKSVFLSCIFRFPFLYSVILSLLWNSCVWALIFYEKYTLQFVCCILYVTLFVYLVPMLKRSTNFIT